MILSIFLGTQLHVLSLAVSFKNKSNKTETSKENTNQIPKNAKSKQMTPFLTHSKPYGIHFV